MTVLEIPAYAYHTDQVGTDQPSLSASVIHELVTKTPAHARAIHPRLNLNLVREDAAHFDIGTVSHSLFLEGETSVTVVEADSWRTKAAQEARDFARAHGKIPLLDIHWQDVQDMTAAVREQLAALDVKPAMFTDGKAEQTLVWQENGVWCRARLDWLRDDHSGIDDYKTTSSARPEKWSVRMFDFGCDIQAAFYLRGVQAVLGTDAAFRFAVVEKTAPYALTLFEPGPDVLELANRKIDYALEAWDECLATDVWPAYPTRPCTITLPTWAENQWYERTFRDEVAA